MQIEFINDIADATRIAHQGADESFPEYAARLEEIGKAASAAFGEDIGWHWDDVDEESAVAVAYRGPRPDDTPDMRNQFGLCVDIGYIKIG